MNNRFDILDTPIQELKVIQRKILGDSRGYFERLFCVEEFKQLTPGKGCMQVNHSLTEKRGTIRGMHFQLPPHAETKFVSCLRGSIFDIGVDLRQDSPTFLKWYGETLSAENHKTLVIPEGFAHGYQTLEENCELVYISTEFYEPEHESGIRYNDPSINITWPMELSNISDKDKTHLFIESDFKGIKIN
ncbi:MAG: dTDP-4-dehydrorhamnose 3,5-epimerase [Candidatus Scalindua sp.]